MSKQWLFGAVLAGCLAAMAGAPLAHAAPSRAPKLSWGWSTATSLPAPNAGVAVGHDGRIYVIGGWYGSPSRQMFVYGPRSPSHLFGA